MSWAQFSRIRWQAALQIHGRLLERRALRQQMELPVGSWHHLEEAISSLSFAQQRGWHAAVAELNYQISRSISEVLQRLQQVQQIVRHRIDDPDPLTVPQISQELKSLTEEFPEVDLDLRAREIRVTTDHIQLEDIDLGRFQIVLNWTKLSRSHPYHIEPLDPFPAESKEDLVHPHVSDGTLCEGDGQVAIRHALDQGRIADFFLLVHQVLSTYNADSAYLALDNWQGRPCSDCGTLVHEEDARQCHSCEDLLCCECSGVCCACSATCCRPCQRFCAQCENTFCSSCLTSCSACDASHCEGCLVDGQCFDCQANEDTSNVDLELQPTEPETTAESPLHPLCVGEAVVSA